ncbi:MAG: hypothetical protein IKI51_03180 [Clostridia bacterium]|nr:hypothetical protein [Clostridia bacterium]
MKSVMFTGDSITDVGRARPVGDKAGMLGDSYVGNIFVQMWAKDPRANVKIMNTATSGDTSRQLRARFESEVLAYPADYLFIMIGINDCWREFEDPVLGVQAPSVDEYRDNMEYMIKGALDIEETPVLVSPYFLELYKEDPMRAKCDVLNGVLRELAKKYSLHYIDVQSVFDDYISKVSSYVVSGDRVHPKAIGKQIIAQTIMASDAWKEVMKK